MQPHQQLEHEWADFNDLDPAGMVACSSGTAALHLALEAFQLPPGSEVIVPDFTMIACARAVTLAGLKPVFVDCDDRLLMDVNLLDKDRAVWRGYDPPKALMVVHIYGRRIDMSDFETAITDVSNERAVWLVEDLAEAHGIRPSMATDAACWSFYKNKIIAGEEGGAVWFRDTKHAVLARQLRSLGFTDAHDFNHVPRGHNYRMSNCHASMILESLKSHIYAGEYVGYSCGNGSRREIESWYNKHCPDEWRMPPRDAPWVYDLRIKGGTYHESGRDVERQNRIVSELNRVGIAARHGFKPMHFQREYEGCRVVGTGQCERASREVIYLPIRPGVTTEGSCKMAFDTIWLLTR